MFRRKLAVTVLVGAATAATAVAVMAAPKDPVSTARHTAQPSGAAAKVQLEAWLYPGGPDEPACTAMSEYTDSRLKRGVLKPLYWSATSNGTVRVESTQDGTCNTYSPKNVAHLKRYSAQQYPMLSAMTAANVRALVGTKAKRAAAIRDMTSLVVKEKLNGIDVDMEDYWSWSTADFTNYTRFLKELADALHAKGKRVQVDAPAMTQDADFYDYQAVMRTGVDALTIMAYDNQYDTESGKRCGPITPYNWLKSVTAYAKSKVPVSKLIIALPNYGYIADDPCDTDSIKGSVHFDEMKKQHGFSGASVLVEKRRDASSGEIRWVAGGKLYDYVDRVSLDRKLKVLTSMGITRVSVWTLGGGNPWFTR